MAGIKALTDISQGAAQVFDTSGFVESQKVEQKQNEERLIASMLDYDPNDVWQRDIGKVSEDVDKYENWVMENYDRLTSDGKDRIAAWAEKKNLENGLRNTIAYSKKAGADMKQLADLVLKDPDYATPENKALLAEFYKTPSAESYADRSAFDSTGIQSQFAAAVNIPLGNIAKGAADSYFSAEKVRVDGSNLSAANAKRTLNDQKGFDEYIDNIWNNGDTIDGKFSAAKVQGKYKTKEALAAAVMGLVPKNVEPVYINPKTGKVDAKNNLKFTELDEADAGIKIGAAAIPINNVATTKKRRLFGSRNVEVPEGTQVLTDGDGREYITNARGKKEYVTRAEVEGSEAPAVYDLGIKNRISLAENPMEFNIPGILGGVDIASGKFTPNLFESSSKVRITDIVVADEAVKPVYAKYTALDSEGNPKTYKKQIAAHEVIPAGATLYTDDKYSTVIAEDNRISFVQPSIYAAIQGSTPAIKGKEGDAYTESRQDEGGSTSAKGLVKYSLVQPILGTLISHYPGLQDKINSFKSAPSKRDSDIQRAMELLK